MYNYRPFLFPKDGNVDGERNGDDAEEEEHEGQLLCCTLAVPEGDIFCAGCASHGAASVLEKYINKVDYERSHYFCSRA